MTLNGPPENICLVRLSALGDITLMLAMVRRLQRSFPQSRITWLIGAAGYELLRGVEGVEFLVVDKPRSPGDYWRLRKRLAKRRFDVVLAAQASLRANLVYPLIKAPVKIGFDATRARDGQRYFVNQQIDFAQEHLLDSFMRFADAINAPPQPLQWDLPVSMLDMDAMAQHFPAGDGPLLAINPGASKAERNWTPQGYAAVITHAREQWQARIILTGGGSDAERQLIADIQAQLAEPVADVCGKTSPPQLAALLKQVQVLVSPDTGPLHMARALDVPVVGLYAVAPSWLSGPYQAMDYVVDVYPQAVEKILHKAADAVPWGTRVHDDRAMQLIQPAEVIARLDAALQVAT